MFLKLKPVTEQAECIGPFDLVRGRLSLRSECKDLSDSALAMGWVEYV